MMTDHHTHITTRLKAIGILTVTILASGIIFKNQIVQFTDTVIGDVKADCSALPEARVGKGKETELKQLNDQIVAAGGATSYAALSFERCSGRVELQIIYGSKDDKPKLVELWKRSSLKSIPVHWQNR